MRLTGARSSLLKAVVIALRKRLDREHAKGAASMRTRLARLAADVAIILGEPVVTSSRSA
jgi:hypothetical protein